MWRVASTKPLTWQLPLLGRIYFLFFIDHWHCAADAYWTVFTLVTVILLLITLQPSKNSLARAPPFQFPWVFTQGDPPRWLCLRGYFQPGYFCALGCCHVGWKLQLEWQQVSGLQWMKQWAFRYCCRETKLMWFTIQESRAVLLRPKQQGHVKLVQAFSKLLPLAFNWGLQNFR